MIMGYPEWKELREELVESRGTLFNKFPMIEADMPTFMGQPYAAYPEDLQGADAVYVIMYMLAGKVLGGK